MDGPINDANSFDYKRLQFTLLIPAGTPGLYFNSPYFPPNTKLINIGIQEWEVLLQRGCIFKIIKITDTKHIRYITMKLCYMLELNSASEINLHLNSNILKESDLEMFLKYNRCIQIKNDMVDNKELKLYIHKNLLTVNDDIPFIDYNIFNMPKSMIIKSNDITKKLTQKFYINGKDNHIILTLLLPKLKVGSVIKTKELIPIYLKRSDNLLIKSNAFICKDNIVDDTYPYIIDVECKCINGKVTYIPNSYYTGFALNIKRIKIINIEKVKLIKNKYRLNINADVYI